MRVVFLQQGRNDNRSNPEKSQNARIVAVVLYFNARVQRYIADRQHQSTIQKERFIFGHKSSALHQD